MSSSQKQPTNITSELRPRNRRLISVEDGNGITQQSVEQWNDTPRSYKPAAGPRTTPLTGNIAESSSSAYGQRLASPPRSGFASRTSSANGSGSGSTRWGLPLPTPKSAGFLFSPKYWEESWSSLQGVATTLLGSELQNPPRSATVGRSKHNRQPSRFGLPADDEWGPTINVENATIAGSQEDRRSQIEARKRQALLSANEHSTTDFRGRHKRKSSVDEIANAVTEQSEDALVYIHPVQPTDTVMGLAIKYGCSEAIVRKANRLWANDSMQLRRLAYIPIDACTVRGKKISTPVAKPVPIRHEKIEDLLPPTPGSEIDWSIATTPKASQGRFDSIASPTISTTTTSYDTIPYIHESWVQIDGFTTSTEIARLPRRTLGFFPPARRKSNSYHDKTPSNAGSPVLSAIDAPSEGSTKQFSPSFTSSAGNPHTRPRAVSSLTSRRGLPSVLRGTGGVGTLDSRAPGPQQDQLNAFFALHFPNAAPPLIPPGLSGRPSFESLRSGLSTPTGTGVGLDQLGGKVETWVRKLATKGRREFSNGPTGRGSRRGSAGQLVASEVQGEGDLIELIGGIDIGGSAPGTNVKGKTRLPESRLGVTSAIADDAETLAERFPVGGRVFDSVGK